MREELLRIVADRMDLSTDLLNSLLAQHAPSAAERDEPQSGSAPSSSARRPLRSGAARSRSARSSSCASRCRRSARPALAALDLEADLATPALRRAAAHLREHLHAPTEACSAVTRS